MSVCTATKVEKRTEAKVRRDPRRGHAVAIGQLASELRGLLAETDRDLRVLLVEVSDELVDGEWHAVIELVLPEPGEGEE